MTSTSHMYDNDIQDVQRVAPEDLASQMTLIDLAIFGRIQPHELASGQWTGSHKYHHSPNVVALTQRFNRVSFWVIQEILSHKSAKHRAEVLAHFIRVAQQLLELNNTHSAYAIKSALSSAPIHRLNKTWAYLSKKDKQSLKQLDDLFADTDNFERLRDHLSASKNPCIPYLGIYLHDIVYVDVAHPLARGRETPHRKHKMDAILNTIADFQRSTYDNLTLMPNVQKYLLSVRYIEELQKFLEEDNFNLSLSLEPPENDGKSVFYVRESTNQTRQSLNGSNGQTIRSSQSSTRLSVSFNCADTQSNANPMASYSKRRPFIAGHRKANSLGTNVLSSITTAIPLTSKTNVKTFVDNKKNLCLIDDSLINDDPIVQMSTPVREPSELSFVPSLPTIEIIYDESEPEVTPEVDNNKKCDIKKCPVDVNRSLMNEKIIFQGMVKRKTVFKEGKKPPMANWVRYWLVLQGTQLLYFDSKHFKTYQTNIFQSSPLKCRSLKDWMVALVEDQQSADTFTLSDIYGHNVYKYRAPTSTQAFEWYKKISQQLSQLKSTQPAIASSLIDFNDDSVHKNRLSIPTIIK